MPRKLDTGNIREWITTVEAGETILLSGVVYSARDAAHKKFMEIMDNGGELPIELNNAVIYYCGPTPAKPDMPIGSCGPTTSIRMDGFTPRLLSNGLAATIGKGGRDETVRSAIKEYGAAYFCAMGGAGAIAAKSITAVEVVAFPELGCESVKRMHFNEFPLIVGIDSSGNSVFEN